MLQTIGDAIWLGTAIDCEGWITFRIGKPKKWMAMQICIEMTSKEFIEKFAKLTNSRVHSRVRKGKHFGTKEMYSVHVTGKDKLVEMLPQIIPHLIIKREKAEAMLKFIQENPHNRKTNMASLNKSLPRTRGGWNSKPALRINMTD